MAEYRLARNAEGIAAQWLPTCILLWGMRVSETRSSRGNIQQMPDNTQVKEKVEEGQVLR